ncbi:biotin transport system substrate-specific component [Poseidonocella pacifica]|uniref:Biotin transporter n=1 Tax=Poseidonocella pacifica TaxID=871651 RepID=A0A1I0V911_9RHOB|nr:biotin transporter BioY [Poseidonocella pacifica]SFA72533.1 biotin transport system substrate-specific component [Poseidonocella pacifica]
MTRNTVLGKALLGYEALGAKAALVLAASFFVAIAAQITVPFFPVPMTLQTMAVLLVGATLGARMGTLALLAYVAEGAMGLPVFSKGGAGFAHLMGPSGGYIWGFVIAATLAGFAADRGLSRRLVTLIPALMLANAALYLPGLVQLKLLTGAAWEQVWTWGAGPFLLGDLVKLVIVALIVTGGWKALSSRRQS